MLALARRLVLQACIHLLALFSAARTTALNELKDCTSLLATTVSPVGKGVGGYLRSGVALLFGSDAAEQSFLSYVPSAVAGVSNTYRAVFHNKSSWLWLAFLDVSALWAVARQHRQEHAEAAAAASVRRAAADPSNTSTSRCPQPSAADLQVLRGAAVHSKAAYGVPAASGHVSSAAGFLKVVTLHQATSRAPRRIPAASHLAAVQQLTGCPPADVLAAQWQAHHHRPAFYVAVDRRRRCVVVSVRGTLQLGDFCTVLDATPTPVVLSGVAGHVHTGFMAAARSLLPQVAAALAASAASCPGWPVLLTGHSLGGGVAAVLTALLLECDGQLAGLDWRQLGDVQCVGIGAAAAFCRVLGSWCRPRVTSVLYGADCLPMFSALGARLLIEQVHASSRAASTVKCLLDRSGLMPKPCAATSSLHRTTSTTTAPSSAPSSACEAACSGDNCRSVCGAAADGASELQEIEAVAASATGRHRSDGSVVWSSSTSSASITAFAGDAAGDNEGEAEGGGGREGGGDVGVLVPMYPPGRILWMLPSQRGGTAASGADLGLYVVDQTSFARFLLTIETAAHHLPDSYIAALDRLPS